MATMMRINLSLKCLFASTNYIKQMLLKKEGVMPSSTIESGVNKDHKMVSLSEEHHSSLIVASC